MKKNKINTTPKLKKKNGIWAVLTASALGVVLGVGAFAGVAYSIPQVGNIFIKEQTSENSDLLNKIKDLQTKLKQTETQKLDLENQLENIDYDYKVQINELQTNLTNKEKELFNANIKLEEMRNQINPILEEIENLNNEIEQLTTEKEQLQLQIESLNNEHLLTVNELKAQIQFLKEQIFDLKNAAALVTPGIYDDDNNLLYSWNYLMETNIFKVENNILKRGSDYTASIFSTKLIIPGDYEDIHASIISTKVKSIIFLEGCKRIRSTMPSTLLNIILPSTLIYVDEDAFKYCKSLEFNYYNQLPYLGCFYNPYFCFFGNSNLENVILNPYCELISRESFFNNLTIKSVTASARIIGTNAFLGCENLETVNLNNVERICSSAFYSCSNLVNVNLSNKLRIIEDNAFMSCINLETIVISENIETIGDSAFDTCSNLKNVTIESPFIYNATNGVRYNFAGALLGYATNVKVLKTIVDNASNNNTYLNSDKFTKTESGEYYIYSKN